MTTKLNSICNEIGLLKAKCHKFVKAHLGELIEELTTTDDVRTICVNTGACKWVIRPNDMYSLTYTNNIWFNFCSKYIYRTFLILDNIQIILSFPFFSSGQRSGWTCSFTEATQMQTLKWSTIPEIVCIVCPYFARKTKLCGHRLTKHSACFWLKAIVHVTCNISALNYSKHLNILLSYVFIILNFYKNVFKKNPREISNV